MISERTQQTPDSRPKIEVIGNPTSRIIVLDEEISESNTVERLIAFKCTSGELIEAVWKGIPLIRVLEKDGVPPEVTHILLKSIDGYTGCISIQIAIDGLIAIERDGQELNAPRFVAPDIVGPRAVKDIRKIKPLKLAPNEDQEAYENYTRT